MVCSYALNECLPETRRDIVAKAWQATKETLVLIEPGTPLGFSAIKTARTQLIKEGGFLVAPCTHENACPLTEGDWCHFSARLERLPFHRKIKDAQLGYEDEKYSYLIVSKKPFVRPAERIVRQVLQRPGHLILDVCGQK